MIKYIILDFGHGGLDANGNYTTAPSKMHTFDDGEIAYEGEINRQIGGILYQLLRWHNEFKVICTVRPDDPRDISLSQRVRVANKYPVGESIFISIHSNASKNHQSRGFELYTSKGQTNSDLLAECIASNVEWLYNRIGLNLRFRLSDGDKDKEKDFYVLRKTKGIAVLLECLFFDNKEDYKYLKNTKFQKDLAFAIYKGILDFINKNG